MTAEFAGKRVLVTGSTRGIGRATAELIRKRGGEVMWHGRRMEDAVAAAGGGVVVAGDLGDRATCRRVAAEAGEVDVLINCAGVLREAAVPKTTEALWDETFAVNLTAAWVLTRALLSGLRRRAGVVVNVASDAALLGYVNCSAYAASKGALVGLTKALAVELAPVVRAVAVCPGPVATDMLRGSADSEAEVAAIARAWSAPTMLGRVATPEEVAEVIAFVASPRASYMTGSVVAVDGGATAGRRVAI